MWTPNYIIIYKKHIKQPKIKRKSKKKKKKKQLVI